MKLAELSFAEAESLRDRGALVLLPIGSTEAHGPHLPLSTDVIISEEMARRAWLELETEGKPTVIAPTLSYAITEYAASFTGTISLPAATAEAMVSGVVEGLIGQGFRRVCLVNSHLEPAHVSALRDVCQAVEHKTGHKVAFPDKTDRRWARMLTEEFKRGACHAGSYETSLVLAARPELVRDRIRAALEPLAVDLARAMKAGVRTFVEAGAEMAYFGDPAAATVEEGNAIYALLTTMIVTTVAETWPASQPPQP
jgi:creatinine amidohydrolase